MAERDHIAAYNDVRTRLTDLTLGLDDAALAARVPASPDWCVKDVVAHVTGITTDLLAGNLEGVGSDAWTRSQVESRREVAIENVLAEWAGNAPALDEGMRVGRYGHERARSSAISSRTTSDVRAGIAQHRRAGLGRHVHRLRAVRHWARRPHQRGAGCRPSRLDADERRGAPPVRERRVRRSGGARSSSCARTDRAAQRRPDPGCSTGTGTPSRTSPSSPPYPMRDDPLGE